MGPLAGLKVVELAGLAPAPFACTVLADLGADVVRVDRAKPGFDVLSFPNDPLTRGRRWIGVDMKSPEGLDLVLRLVDEADVLVEGFRPGVAERMGLGPDALLARNPGLVYGRITGWGQDGPLAPAAGHDINYIAISGALEPIGQAGAKPTVPLNLLGDFGGGGLMLAMGVLAALFERQSSGRGQVVDASMVDGAALLTTSLFGLRNLGLWNKPRGENLLDGGAPFYDTYETSDGKYVAVGAIETRFFGELVKVLGLEDVPDHLNPENWPALRDLFGATLRTRTRDEWAKLAEGTDACLSPVLTPEEAPSHPHNVARATFVEVGGITQPAPAPKFSRTVPPVPAPPSQARADTSAVLGELGLSEAEISRLRAAGTVA
ncbi:Alpha-methylacyl-CoA racemase [Alloactinosynnema sp. L-07]|uniref:CaiB/BaiF CoA transferase family protein n=1 Tax=Alloactinosynnema sp. L-07 TaxID=1653480 RepID=UPI00065F076E|nr:CaiB/BaiF CoA-transferase family protein [Alloactinosynnema sp. L-07]CRK58354.1 Alpha-methylacyl-CoA racemase [Alloactinosynnema sp. L-07]